MPVPTGIPEMLQPPHPPAAAPAKMGTPKSSRLVPEKQTNAKKSEPRKPDSDKGYVLVGGVQYWKPDVKRPKKPKGEHKETEKKGQTAHQEATR